MRDRNWRRGQRDRVIARTLKWMKSNGWLSERFSGPIDPEDLKARLGKNARTPHPCSNYCCGNPRRHWHGFERLTIQEHKAVESAADQLRDAYRGEDHSE